MQAGKRRNRVVIQSILDAPDLYGNAAGTAVDGDEVWASIEPGAGREFLQADQLSAEQFTTIGMQYYAGLTPRHQLKFGARIFSIVEIRNVEERSRDFIILCKEVPK